jgi:hypothetical protein
MLTTKQILFTFLNSCVYLKVAADLGYAFEYSTLVMYHRIRCYFLFSLIPRDSREVKSSSTWSFTHHKFPVVSVGTRPMGSVKLFLLVIKTHERKRKRERELRFFLSPPFLSKFANVSPPYSSCRFRFFDEFWTTFHSFLFLFPLESLLWTDLVDHCTS